jgi:DNA-binding CsgD family transcriptional regulator
VVSIARHMVASTAEAAFASDSSGNIVAWNPAAERLLGFTGVEVLGKACYKSLCGRDVFGNPYCSASCPIRALAMRGDPVSRFEIVYCDACGKSVRTSVSIMSFQDEASKEPTLVHLLQPLQALTGGVEDSEGLQSAKHCRVDVKADHLTPRQIEVLRLLADGLSTVDIAERLFISEVTVRNHIENLLHKLEVHSRLEAVVLAHQRGLLKE